MATGEAKTQNHERALGMDQRISRRDYLNSTLLASGSALVHASSPLRLLGEEEWDGYSGVGDYQGSNGNTGQVISDGHKIRDHAYDKMPSGVEDTREVYDCVVVGGGISGLAAALFFERRQTERKRTCLVLENHAIFGGEAKRNEFLIDGQRLIAHQGSAMFFPPLPGTFLAEFYQSIGIDRWQFPYQTWSGHDAEIPLGRTSYTDGGRNSGFYFGAKFGKESGQWLIDPWGKKLEGAPISAQARAELRSMPGKERKLPKEQG